MLFQGKSKCDVWQPIIVSAENRVKHIARNKDRDRVFQYQIDGDVIPSSSPGLRCDYLLENETKRKVYLIELKGTDVSHAVDQIEATIIRYREALKNYTIMPRIVYRGNTHSVNSSKVVVFKRKYPCIIKTDVIEEDI